MTKRHIAFDTETTGIGYKVHRLTEIAAVEFDPRTGAPTGNNFHAFVNPGREVPPEAVKVHGKTWDDLKAYPKFPDIAPAMLEFLEGSEVVIHNAPFDVGFVNAELKRAKLPLLDATVAKVTDTLALSRRHVRMKKHTLDNLCDRYGVDRTKRTLHGALIDCEMLAQVFPHLRKEADAALARINSILPFTLDEQGELPLEDMVERVFVLDELAKLLSKEKDRYREAVKGRVEGLNVEGEFFEVLFKNRTETDWDRILEEHLPGFNKAPYQKSGSAMYIEYR